MPAKYRADQLVFEAGLAPSREQAKRLIMAGQVFIMRKGHKQPLEKPGQQLPAATCFVCKGQPRFVSRGGEKLLTAIEHWNICLDDCVCLDAGASTGGFTDCMLQHGAQRVYAVDVGYGQLHASLRSHPQVVNKERVNMRYASADLIPEVLDFVSADVSFISLTKIIPACLPFMAARAGLVTLIKPQFEAGPGQTVKGVIHDRQLQTQIVDCVVEVLTKECRLRCLGTVPAAITGPKGNQEYLAYFHRRGE